MLKYFCMLFFPICACPVLSQEKKPMDILVYYRNACNYIAKDSVVENKTIAVADSIVDLIWVSVKPEKDCLEKKIFKEFYMNKYDFFEPYFSPVLSSLSSGQEKRESQWVVFFSKLKNNTLRADLFSSPQSSIGIKAKFNYNSYCFGESYEYLFIFDTNGSITKVIRRKVILN